MIGTKFFDNREGGGEFEITHITGQAFTVLVTRKPKEGVLTVAQPKMRLSENEFVMTMRAFVNHIVEGNILVEEWS